MNKLDAQNFLNFLGGFDQEIRSNSFQSYLVAAGIIVVGLILILSLRSFLRNQVAKLLSNRTEEYSENILVTKAIKKLFSLLLIVPFFVAFSSLTFSPDTVKAIQLIFLILFTWRAMVFFTRFFVALFDAMLSKTEGYMGVRAVSPIITFIVWAIGLSFLLDNFGLKISSLMAGLGIMGIAVGLASQAVLGDFFGYLAILLDRPFKIGDVVSVGANRGTIERVGFKTTKIRAATGELIAVPNGDISKQPITNNAMSIERGRLFQFGITYETPLEKVKSVPDIIGEIVNATPGARLVRVHFISFADSSLLFEVFFMVQTTSGAELLDAQHCINMEMMERFAKEGIEFAYPTSTLHLANVGGIIGK